MSHPDPAAAPDLRPIEPGEVWENPVTLERAVLLEAPWWNAAGRAVADMTALPGARVVGEHLHPALYESFTVREGELTNEGHVDAVVRVEVTPGERFAHMIETLFGLAREGHVNKRGMPHPLRLGDIIVALSTAPRRLSAWVLGSGRGGTGSTLREQGRDAPDFRGCGSWPTSELQLFAL